MNSFSLDKLKYKIDIKEEPFAFKSVNCPATVIVTFFNSFGAYSRTESFGLMDREAIYEKIRKNEDICLDHCYVKDFSLSEYRNKENLGDRDYVVLNNFSASHVFFDAEKGIDLSFCEFKGDHISFEGALFGDRDINFYKAKFCDSMVNFSDAKFGHGNINFQFAEFGKGNVSFQHTSFGKGDISFVNCEFNQGNVSFKEAHFDDGAFNIHFSRFGDGDLSFEKARFGNGTVDFRKVEFGKGKVDFRRTNFGNGTVNFEESEFGGGKINFRSAVFGIGNISFEMTDFSSGEVSFEKAEFHKGNISFNNCKINVSSFKGCHFNNYVDMRVAEAKKIDLSNTVVRDIIDFKPVKHHVLIEDINITGMRNLGRIFVGWKENELYKLISGQSYTSLREKSDQFRTIKENFSILGHYNEEDSAYVEFKRFEARAELQEVLKRNRLNAIWMYPLHGFKWLVFDKMGLYATNPVRVLLSMWVVYGLFSLIYTFLPFIADAGISCSGADNGYVSHIKIAFYYSAITFLTVGYGDCLPVGQVKWMAPMEAWIGVFLMSYFTVAFVRKILR